MAGYGEAEKEAKTYQQAMASSTAEKNLPAAPPPRSSRDDPAGSPYRDAVSAQQVTLDLWAAGQIALAELRDRFRAHAAALLAGAPR